MTSISTSASPRLPAVAAEEKPVLKLAGPELTPENFSHICTIAYRAAGLSIGSGKSAMVRARLSPRLRVLGFGSFDDYCRFLDGPDGQAETGILVSALTTNVSHFFREAHHFELFKTRVLPRLIERAKQGERVRIWSAGCAHGQEPYSIVMTMKEAGMPLDRDVRVLATDIDPIVIEHARDGVYPERMLSGLSDTMRARFFKPIPEGARTQWQIDRALRDPVKFRILNLVEDWPMRGRFDAIFCRNVAIYFDEPTQGRLWQRFAQQIAPDGWLFIGHSERLPPMVRDQFEGRGLTAYQRVAARAANRGI